MIYAEIADEEYIRSLEGLDLRQDEIDELLNIVGGLKAENAELKARLEKAVELPCKVGDKVFAIVGHRECVEEFEVTSIEILKSGIYVRLAGFFKMSLSMTEYGKRWFTDLEAAEAKLKERQGGKGNVDNRS